MAKNSGLSDPALQGIASGAKKASSPAFTGNKTYGRIKSLQCRYDDINPADPKAALRQRLNEQQQRYTDHVSGVAHLPPEQSLALRADIDRLSQIVNPGQQNLWSDYSQEEKNYLAQVAEKKRSFANNLGMLAGGPVFSVLPMVARLLGAPENVVEDLGTVNADLASIGLFGRGRIVGEVANGPRPAAPVTRSGTRVLPVARGSPGNGLYVSKNQGVTFEGKVYRYTKPEYETTTWDAHEYNVNSNHRYTAPGQGGVYAGGSPETAMAEMSHYGPTDGLKLVSKDIRVDNMLDLSNPAVRENLGVSLQDITSNSYKVTHELGGYAIKNGYNGIIAPSARNVGGVNIIVFKGM